VTSGKITEENATPPMLFYGKMSCYRVYSLIEIDNEEHRLENLEPEPGESKLKYSKPKPFLKTTSLSLEPKLK
jgi:hypothetical protein